jgi:hypothetical protein
MGNRGPQQSNDDPTLSPQWSEQLSKKARADLGGRLAEFKTLDDFVQAYLDAAAPGEIRPERPGKPEDYKFAKSEPAFAKTAWEANLSVEQADALYAASLSQLDVARQSVKAAMAKDMAATEALLRDEYGGRYDEAVAFMNRGLGINPATGALSPIAQSLFDAGLSAKPEIVRAFIELGRAVSEGSAPGGSVGAPLPASVMQGRGFGYKSSYN